MGKWVYIMPTVGKDLLELMHAHNFPASHIYKCAAQLKPQLRNPVSAGCLPRWNIKSATSFPAHISSYSGWWLNWYVNKASHHSLSGSHPALFKHRRRCIIRYVARWWSPAEYLAIKPQSASSETAVGPGKVHLCMKYSQSNNANLKHQ